jgi:predicted DNA-binding mobile mystery protein A
MTSSQLGKRTGMAQPRIVKIEKDEITGNITLKTMERIAGGLNCRFIYGFVPQGSLESILRSRAEEIAKYQVSHVSHTMDIEDQKLSEKDITNQIKLRTKEIMENPSQNLWNI